MENADTYLLKFRGHLEALGRSPATISLYSDQAGLFLRTVEVKEIRQVTRRHIEDYVAGLHGRDYTVGTICTKVRAVKRLFEFLEGANIVFIDPAECIREPAKPKTLPRAILTPEEMSLILDQPNLGLMTGIRDRAILEVFYTTGVRLEELCRLTVFDADLPGKQLRVNRGKGGRDRVVPLGRHAVRFLREYITRTRPELTRPDRSVRRLFVGRGGAPISNQAVSLMVRTCARKAGLAARVTAHTFRHTFASALVKNGADIVAVQKMMGHATAKTTQQYIRSLGLDVKAVHKKTHPRERDGGEVVKPEIRRMKHAATP